MKTYNIGIIVLNYLAYIETKNLVKQFLSLNTENTNIQIIIVDNFSPNNSFQILKNYFKNNRRVLVVQTSKNIGFANGNNFGYFKLKQLMRPDYVVFSNSDIVLKDKDLFQWIYKNDEKYHFGLLGPSIYSLRFKIHQNPCDNWSENLWYNFKLLKRMELKRIELKILFLFFKSKNFNKKNEVNYKEQNNYNVETKRKTLHGAFLIMSKRYLNQFEAPFDTGTFLYMEEAIIRYRCETKNIPMVYSPDYEVNHLQAISTEKVSDSDLKRKILRKNNEIKSLKRFIQILQKSKKYF